MIPTYPVERSLWVQWGGWVSGEARLGARKSNVWLTVAIQMRSDKHVE